MATIENGNIDGKKMNITMFNNASMDSICDQLSDWDEANFLAPAEGSFRSFEINVA